MSIRPQEALPERRFAATRFQVASSRLQGREGGENCPCALREARETARRRRNWAGLSSGGWSAARYLPVEDSLEMTLSENYEAVAPSGLLHLPVWTQAIVTGTAPTRSSRHWLLGSRRRHERYHSRSGRRTPAHRSRVTEDRFALEREPTYTELGICRSWGAKMGPANVFTAPVFTHRFPNLRNPVISRSRPCL